jgi:type II secretory pathway pseudopilin PulG
VLIIISAVAAVAIPRLRGNNEKQGVRASRAALQTLIAKARAAAIQRGCPATVRLVAPGTVWITTCRIRTTGGTLDTLGGIENLAARYTVVMATSVDSIRFDPRGLNSTFQQAVVRFTAGSITDSVNVNAVGKVVR